MNIGTIIALAIAIIAAILIYKLLKRIVLLLYNGLVGIVIFWILNTLEIIQIPIDIWTFLIAAIGGIVGVIAVILLSMLGIPL